MRDGWFYQIQATCRRGCDNHQPGEWRKSRNLYGVTDEAEARRLMEEYAREFPRSVPYRLVIVEPPVVIPAQVTMVEGALIGI